MLTETGSDALLRLHRTDGLARMFRAHAVRAHYRVYSQSPSASRRSISATPRRPGIVTLIVLGRKGPHGFPFRRPHSHFPIH